MTDGRYVLRDSGEERVLVLETLGAPAPTHRRRRRVREAKADAAPSPLPLARTTLVRAYDVFADEAEAKRWLEASAAAEDTVDALLAEAIEALNRALHAHAVASGDPAPQALSARRAVAARIGYGSGEQVASGEFSAAREVDVHTGGASRRRQRAEELRPQERIAAVLGGREQFDACETLILRARADLDAGRAREAALQLRVGLEALLVELKGALADPGHEEDMAAIAARRGETGDLANHALRDDLDPAQLKALHELLSLCERALRRRRILKG
ncbi:MAG TPA: hypothetical protein VF093_04255 [Solirubrobacterales bacterium]